MNEYKIRLGTELNTSDLKSDINALDNKFKLKLGVDVKVDDIRKRISEYNKNTNNAKLKLKVNLDTDDIKKQIKQLSIGGIDSGKKMSIPIDTQSLEASFKEVKAIITDIRNAIGAIDNNGDIKSLVSSINQMASALGKAENESDSLVKSLSALSKKDFGVNIGLDLNKKGNNNMVAYGRQARKQVIPQLEAQIKELEGLFGGQQATIRKLTQHGKNVGFDIFADFEDFNSDSAIKKMEAMEKYIGSLKKLASIDNVSLDGFNTKFSKTASELIDDIAGVDTAVDKASDIPEKLKNIFGSGVNADNLNIQLDDIVTNLNEIKTALQGLSSGNPLGGLTQSFDRLSGSIENLLKNAEKVKGVLGSVDVGKIDANIGTTKKNTIQTRKNNSGSEIDGFLKEFNLTGENAKIVRDKFASLTEAMSHGINSDAYEESLVDLINTVKKLGTVSKQADNDMELLLNELQKRHLDVSGDYYKQEFGDDWKSARSKHQSMLADKNSRTKMPVDVAYAELSEAHPLYFPKDIWNQADQLRKIFEVYDTAKLNSKNRKVDVSEIYSDSDLRDWTSDIVGGIQEQIKAEQQLAQVSTETTRTVVQNENSQKQALEDALARKKQRLEEINREYDALGNRHTEVLENENLSYDEKDSEIFSISLELDKLEEEENLIKTQIKSIEESLESEARKSQETANVVTQNEERKQQAYQETANIIQSVSKQTSLVRGNVDFKQDFNSGNQSAKEAQKYFEALLKEEKAVVSVKENFDKSLGNSGELKSFTVDIQRATGEVEKLHYAMSSADNDNRFLYQGASVSDRNIEKQTEARIKSADKLQTQLEKIKSDYNDMGNAKPIKDSDHINALDKQYRRVEKAIDDIRNADNTMSSSVISNAEKQKSALEAMVREYRNAETLATSLRSKDINTVGATYSSDLDVLISKMRKDGVYTFGFEKGAENLRSVLSDAVANKDKNGLVGFLNGLDKLEAGYKRASAAKKEFNQSESVGIDTSTLRSRIENLQRISPEIDKFETEINGARVTVKSLLNDLDNIKVRGDFNVVNKRFNSFEKAAESAGIAVKELSQSSVKASFTKEINQEINDFIKLQKQIENTRFEVGKLEITGDSTNQIAELKRHLEELENTYDSLMQAFLKKVSVNADIVPDDALSKLDNGITEATTNANNRLEQFKAKWADTRAELAKGIKADIELGNFDNEIDAMRVKFNSLSDANDELRLSYNATEDAYKAMMNAAKANTGDEVADRERLIQAEKQYAAALEKTNNLIKQQARADKIANDAEKLADKKTALKLDMANYLKNNSRAAKEFGDEIRRLSSLLDNVNLDDVDVNKISRTFNNLIKKIKNDGKDGLTVFDRLKSKAKEYMTYLSAAEVFMWIEQGMREMFNTVKEIDTAMTGLYRVTDLTASQYDALFDNMIDSAKEYGATLNDIINATTDWVRAGFEADTALGLAEVTTMYQHISDLDYDTAAENLITAYNGFKDELNGAFSGDTVSAVNYIADILNELDNNYAATSAGIGEALTRSASALDLAGNSIQETAG